MIDPMPSDAKAEPAHLAIAFSLHHSSQISCLSGVPLQSQLEKVAREQTWRIMETV